MDATVAPSARANLMQRRRTRWLLIVTSTFVVAGVVAAGYWWLYARHYEQTDDAYVASVDARDDSGPQLASVPRKDPVLSTNIYEIDDSEIKARVAEIVADNAPPATATARGGAKVGGTATSVRGTRLSASH